MNILRRTFLGAVSAFAGLLGLPKAKAAEQLPPDWSLHVAATRITTDLLRKSKVYRGIGGNDRFEQLFWKLRAAVLNCMVDGQVFLQLSPQIEFFGMLPTKDVIVRCNRNDDIFYMVQSQGGVHPVNNVYQLVLFAEGWLPSEPHKVTVQAWEECFRTYAFDQFVRFLNKMRMYQTWQLDIRQILADSAIKILADSSIKDQT